MIYVKNIKKSNYFDLKIKSQFIKKLTYSIIIIKKKCVNIAKRILLITITSIRESFIIINNKIWND